MRVCDPQDGDDAELVEVNFRVPIKYRVLERLVFESIAFSPNQPPPSLQPGQLAPSPWNPAEPNPELGQHQPAYSNSDQPHMY